MSTKTKRSRAVGRRARVIELDPGLRRFLSTPEGRSVTSVELAELATPTKPTPRQLALVADMLENGEPGANNGCLHEYGDAFESVAAWLRELAGTTAVAEVDAAIQARLAPEQRETLAALRERERLQ